jgi:electron transport complex protein RnfC
MERFFALDCMECGSCSYACSSGIPIVQLIRIGKGKVREDRARENKAKGR